MRHKTLPLLAVAMLLSLPTPALAYIGPGAGISAIGTAIALIGAFLLLLVGFVWYPLKRLLGGRRAAPPGEPAERDES